MLSRFVTLFTAVGILAAPSWGAILTQTLGQQNFADGSIVGTAAFTGVVDTAPFNTFVGSDVAGPNFSASWTFSNFGPVVGPITSASLLIAAYEFDTTDIAVSHLVSFLMNGTSLTAVLDAAFKASPDTNSQIHWYTISLPSSTFAQLATGSATFSLTLQNGAGVLGATPFNGAGIDFSTLTVNTQEIPEPSTFFAMLCGLAAIIVVRRRRARC